MISSFLWHNSELSARLVVRSLILDICCAGTCSAGTCSLIRFSPSSGPSASQSKTTAKVPMTIIAEIIPWKAIRRLCMRESPSPAIHRSKKKCHARGKIEILKSFDPLLRVGNNACRTTRIALRQWQSHPFATARDSAPAGSEPRRPPSPARLEHLGGASTSRSVRKAAPAAGARQETDSGRR